MSNKTNIAGCLAVVTGASSGIGLCFCKELASRGCSIMMISNQQSELSVCAQNISNQFGVTTLPFFCDLTAPDAPDRIFGFIDAKNLQPDILINNAGIFSFLPVTDTSERKIESFIDLHISAVTKLSRAFAIRFAERKRGYILNMSSMSCWMPMPGIALYSATKAYIRTFSRALHYEMRDAGVSVTVACPGGIATNLFGLPPKLQKLALNLHAIQKPETFAHKAIDKMLHKKSQYINGLINRIAIVFVASLPRSARMLIKHKMLDKNITRP